MIKIAEKHEHNLNMSLDEFSIVDSALMSLENDLNKQLDITKDVKEKQKLRDHLNNTTRFHKRIAHLLVD